jgi:hypothetical protein
MRGAEDGSEPPLLQFSMIERQIDSPMPRPEGLVGEEGREKLVHVLRLDADTGVRDRDEHMTGFVLAIESATCGAGR